MSSANPFTISIPELRVSAIRDRVAAFDWDDFPDAGGWSAGMDKATMRRIAAYWCDAFDWRSQEVRLNALPQFTAVGDGLEVHFVHIRASGNAQHVPLLLLHGWPGSFIEFEAAAERLAYPERFGGKAEDGIDPVIPSLPGYGFSGRPRQPMGPRAMAHVFDTLMTQVLGYQRYIAQGGDWGSIVSSWLAHDYAETCAGLHLNFVLMQTANAKPQSDQDKAFLDRASRMRMIEGGAHQQGTRPQTLGYALADTPVGTKAWIIEKFAAWSDLPRPDGAPDLEAAYTLDQLLTNTMLYIATGSVVTSTWIYKAAAEEGGSIMTRRVEVPTGVAAFPDPIFPPPLRAYAEQSFNIVRWTDMSRGGHFAAMEQPEAFADEVRAFALGTG